MRKQGGRNSAIIWRGLSMLDGRSPIVVVVTGMARTSTNSKTGGMVQTYIVRADMTPIDAINSGDDAAICGACPHRKQADGSRSCYVNLATGLSTVGRTLSAYQDMSVSDAATLCAGKAVRIGTYGDPAAVPVDVWRGLTAHASRWTGYTHQWTLPHVQPYRAFLMASVDSARGLAYARAKGWRTFRVRRVGPAGAGAMDKREIVCPASAEGGKRVTCEACGLCAGTSRPAKDITIIDHSVSARAAIKRLPLAA